MKNQQVQDKITNLYEKEKIKTIFPKSNQKLPKNQKKIIAKIYFLIILTTGHLKIKIKL